MRRSAVATAILLALAAPAQGGGIPVYDVAGHTQSLTEAAARAADFARELAELQRQYAQLVQLYAMAQRTVQLLQKPAMLADAVLRNSIVRTNLPPDWQQVYDATNTLRDETGEIRRILANEELTGTVQQMNAYVLKRSQHLAARNQAMGLNAYEGTRKRLEEIQLLQQELNNATTATDQLRIQAQIAVHQGVLQNEQNQFLVMQQLQESEARLAELQRHDIARRLLNPDNQGVSQISWDFIRGQ
jgi:type IV secretion system protein VirB5